VDKHRKLKMSTANTTNPWWTPMLRKYDK